MEVCYCVTSVDDHEELEKFIEESKTVLSTAKFELRGWKHSYSDLESYDLLPPELKCFFLLVVKGRKILGHYNCASTLEVQI
ncbi:hypothetical protein TNIN_246331 [Trichonephila inaurata madagascariensis]|uniref:Uncharacterized protein n=1 Tax=Trichonephila inaurata madagascariensis TaxID=2747483 RepID=A0A8X6JN01_9ARAC|nr:hypothetical protein TNIN_246331 [Trichonephila inaurata madagascariensis]